MPIVEVIKGDFRVVHNSFAIDQFDATYAEIPWNAEMEANYRRGAEAFDLQDRDHTVTEVDFPAWLDQYVVVAQLHSKIHFTTFGEVEQQAFLDALDRAGIQQSKITDLGNLNYRASGAPPFPQKMWMWGKPPFPNVNVIQDPDNWLENITATGTGWTIWDMTFGYGFSGTIFSDAGFLVYGSELSQRRLNTGGF